MFVISRILADFLVYAIIRLIRISAQFFFQPSILFLDCRLGVYGMVIGDYTHPIEPWHIWWPWMTLEGHFGDLLTVVTLCAQLTRDLLALAKFLVFISRRKKLLHCTRQVQQKYSQFKAEYNKTSLCKSVIKQYATVSRLIIQMSPYVQCDMQTFRSVARSNISILELYRAKQQTMSVCFLLSRTKM